MHGCPIDPCHGRPLICASPRPITGMTQLKGTLVEGRIMQLGLRWLAAEPAAPLQAAGALHWQPVRVWTLTAIRFWGWAPCCDVRLLALLATLSADANLRKREIESELTNWMCAASAASQPGLSTGDTPWEVRDQSRLQIWMFTYRLSATAKKSCAMDRQLQWTARVYAVLRLLACPSATCSSAPLASRVEPHLGPTVDVRRNSALSELWDEVSCRDCGSQSISGCSNAAWLYYQSATAVSTSWKLLPTWSFSPLARDDDAESGSVKGIVPGTSVVSDVPAHPRARVLSTLPRASTFGKASCDGARWPPRMIHSSTPLLGTIDG
jgi:hypothetical protein